MANHTLAEEERLDKEINRKKQKMSEYIEFRLLEQKPKTQVIEVMSKLYRSRLGIIMWFGKWRQYAFFPEPETVFNKECLNDIQSYIAKLR